MFYRRRKKTMLFTIKAANLQSQDKRKLAIHNENNLFPITVNRKHCDVQLNYLTNKQISYNHNQKETLCLINEMEGNVVNSCAHYDLPMTLTRIFVAP